MYCETYKTNKENEEEIIMSKFQVGDIVVGTKGGSELYSLELSGFEGKVIKTFDDGETIQVKVIEHNHALMIGLIFSVESKYFKKKEDKERTKVYLASPFFNDKELVAMVKVLGCLRNKDLDVFAPYEHQNKHLEFGGEEWRRATFAGDMEGIHESDVVVAILDGNYTDSGTAAECMAAYLLDKKLIVVNLEGKPINLMIAETVHAVINSLEELEAYDFEKLEPIPYTDYVW